MEPYFRGAAFFVLPVPGGSRSLRLGEKPPCPALFQERRGIEMLLSWKKSLPDSLDGSHCSKTPQCLESLCPNRPGGRMPVQSTPAQAGGIPTPFGAHRLEGWCPGRSFICVQPIVHFFAGGNVGAAALDGDTIPVGFPRCLFFSSINKLSGSSTVVFMRIAINP